MQESIIANISYDKPTKNDIAVGFALFNYTGSCRLIMNYLYTVEKMKSAGIPVFTIELVIKGSNPYIQDAFHVYGTSYLFQKENLFRILESRIPARFSKLLFIDSDVIFDDPAWYDKLSVILETYDVAHCFETVHLLDITYREIDTQCKTIVKAENIHKTYILTEKDGVKYHSGFGWAFTRTWYNKFGFFDNAVLGSGDAFFSYGIHGIVFDVEKTEMYKKEVEEWIATMVPLPRVSYLPVTVYHMFHGHLKDRNYTQRHLFVDNIFDIIYKNRDGVFELADSNLNEKLYEYFKERMDDFV